MICTYALHARRGNVARARVISRASKTLRLTLQKLWYQHIWTYLQVEMESKDVQSAVLQPVLYIVQNSTQEEYDQIVFPSLR